MNVCPSPRPFQKDCAGRTGADIVTILQITEKLSFDDAIRRVESNAYEVRRNNHVLVGNYPGPTATFGVPVNVDLLCQLQNTTREELVGRLSKELVL